MSSQPYKNEFGSWLYPTLPDTVRPAHPSDLITPSGKPNFGKLFLCYSYIYKAYVQSKVYQSNTIEDIYKMLNDKVIYVKI